MALAGEGLAAEEDLLPLSEGAAAAMIAGRSGAPIGAGPRRRARNE